MKLPRWVVVVEAGATPGQMHGPLGEHTLIGREPWCDISLEDTHASKRHCELVLASEGVRLKDLGSTNGTFCNGIRVYDVLLGPDSRFRVGDTTMRLVLEEGSQSVFRRPMDATGTLVGASAAMQTLFGVMGRVAPHDIPVLFLGETGTGKTAAARATHMLSPRGRGPFVQLSCAALPPDLVESVLFGHARGAFTGAHRAAAGIFQEGSGGSVLLDDIGDMPLHVQTTLLTVLETRCVRPIGAETDVPVDFRLFCATHRNLLREVAAGRFRQDLYYRISCIDLTVPPLRERHDDLPVLVDWFLARAVESRDHHGTPSPVRALSSGALALLERHTWPGNVRELENVIASAVALAETDLIDASDILLPGVHAEYVGVDWGAEPSANDPGLALPAVEAPPPPSKGQQETFRQFKLGCLLQHERQYFERLLLSNGRNISRAAHAAGISRTYLKMIIKKHGL